MRRKTAADALAFRTKNLRCNQRGLDHPIDIVHLLKKAVTDLVLA